MTKTKRRIDSLGDGKLFRRWLSQLAASAERKHRYMPLTPPAFHRQRVFDKKAGESLTVEIRNVTDLTTFHQVIVGEEYKLSNVIGADRIARAYGDCLARGKTPLIIDCGANIGLAAVYLSREFPKAQIICIEPDAGNVALARRNTEGYPIEVVLGAIGRKSGSATLQDPGLGENAFRVAESEAGEVRVFTVPELVALHGPPDGELFMVKVDIEGFEEDLFQENTDWVQTTRVLAVELHDWLFPGAGTSQPFLSCISRFRRDFQMRGDTAFSIAA